MFVVFIRIPLLQIGLDLPHVFVLLQRTHMGPKRQYIELALLGVFLKRSTFYSPLVAGLIILGTRGCQSLETSFFFASRENPELTLPSKHHLF